MSEEAKQVELVCETCKKLDKQPWAFQTPQELQAHLLADFEAKQPERMMIPCLNPILEEKCGHPLAYHRRTAYSTCTYPGCRCIQFYDIQLIQITSTPPPLRHLPLRLRFKALFSGEIPVPEFTFEYRINERTLERLYQSALTTGDLKAVE